MATRLTDACARTATVLDVYTSQGAGSASYVAGKGRFGGPALQLSGNQVWYGLPDNPTTMLAAFAWSPNGILARGLWMCADGAFNRHLTLTLNTDGTVSIRRGSQTGTVLATSTIQFVANLTNHFELKALINNPSGTFELRLNGNPTPILTFAGNTFGGVGTSVINQIGIENGGSGNVWFSDIHFFDTVGAPSNFIGNKRIYFQLPTSDGGTNQFSTNPAQAVGSHYLNVDEAPPTEDTDYNFDNTVNHRESYGFSALPAGVQGISTVANYSRVRIDDAGPHTYQVGSRSSGVDALSADINPGASYSYGKEFQATDPNTGVSWLKAGVDAATLEVKITS